MGKHFYDDGQYAKIAYMRASGRYTDEATARYMGLPVEMVTNVQPAGRGGQERGHVNGEGWESNSEFERFRRDAERGSRKLLAAMQRLLTAA